MWCRHAAWSVAIMGRPVFPCSLAEFQARFASDATCRHYLAACRWPDAFCCPRANARDQSPQGGAQARGQSLSWKEIPRLVCQPLVRVLGLASRPPFTHDTLHIDRADLMRLPWALCGLALCGDESHLTAAEEAFAAARKITQAKGVVAKVLN